MFFLFNKVNTSSLATQKCKAKAAFIDRLIKLSTANRKPFSCLMKLQVANNVDLLQYFFKLRLRYSLHNEAINASLYVISLILLGLSSKVIQNHPPKNTNVITCNFSFI